MLLNFFPVSSAIYIVYSCRKKNCNLYDDDETTHHINIYIKMLFVYEYLLKLIIILNFNIQTTCGLWMIVIGQSMNNFCGGK